MSLCDENKIKEILKTKDNKPKQSQEYINMELTSLFECLGKVYFYNKYPEFTKKWEDNFQ